MATFIIVVASTAFRTGQQWAWWLLWYIPIWAVLQATMMLALFDINIFGFTALTIVLSLLGLFLPILGFFAAPKPASPASGVPVKA